MMTHICGCYYFMVAGSPYEIRPRRYLPLLNSAAHTTILSTISTTVLKQKFTNPSPTENIEECIYTFPLYDGVSVVGFTCKIGEKVLTGLVKEKIKARKIFEKAVAKGETAGILEQVLEAADVFSTKLGNIPAGQSIIVEITYIGELKHHETEGIRFTIPVSVAPRYGSTAVFAPLNNSQDTSGIEITVDIGMPEGSLIKGVQSPSHPIAVSMGTDSTAAQANPLISKASVTLSLGSAALEKDFVLIVHSKDVGIPKAILETHPTVPNHRALMATLVPKFSLPPSRPEIVFLADRSGSMAGTSIMMLKSAMKVFLKSIPIGIKFNIVSFGSHNSFLWPQSQGYTSQTLHQSICHVEKFDANMGGTETFNAVKATIDRRYSDLPLEIILLTDGDIWGQNELFEYVNQQVASSEGKIRIFPLGIGNGVSHSLIEGLARAGNGFAHAVQSGERLDNSVVRMLRGALSPHITDYTLEVKYEQEDDDFEIIEKVTEGMKVLLTDIDVEKKSEAEYIPTAKISLFEPTFNPEKDHMLMKDAEVSLPNVPYPKLLQAPHKIPSLFSFSRTTVYLLMSPDTIQRNPTSVILRATSAHGPLELEIPIEALKKPAKTIHQLAAKKAVQDLEEGRGWILDAKDHAGILVKDCFPSCFEDLVKREAVRLGEKFQVAGKWCSLVAVSANDKEIHTKREAIAASREAEHGEVLQDFDFDNFLSEDYGMDSFDFDTNSSSVQEETPVRFAAAAGSMPPVAVRKAKRATPQTHASFDPIPRHHMMSASPPLAPTTRAHSDFFMGKSSPTPGNSLFGAPQMQQQQQSQPANAFGALGRGHAAGRAFGSSSQASSGCLFGTQAAFAGGALPNSFHGAGANPMQNNSQGDGNQSLRDYQMQNMLLEQQNKKRFMMARPEESLSASSRLFGSSMQQQPMQPAYNFSVGDHHPPAPSRSVTMGGMIAQQPQHLIGGEPSTTAPEPTGPVYFAANWANKNSAEKVLALIDLQDFEGSWPEGNEEIQAILGFQILQVPAQVDAKIWTTLLVVCFLEVKNTAEEGTWGMVVEKARDWLVANVSTGLEDLEKATIDVVNQNETAETTY